MKNFFRAALIIAVVLALALTIVACDKKADTTTAKPAATTAPKAPGTTPAATTAGQGNATPTTAAPTTATPTTVATTTAAPLTEAPYDMEVPCARIEGSDKKIYAIWNCEYFVVTDEGYVTVDDGCNASIATLVYEDGTPVKWTKGTIEFVIQVTNPETYTSKTGTPGANDSGMIIGIADVPQEELRDYFWESQRGYVMVGCGDGKGLLSASNGRVRASGTAGWSNLFDPALNKWPLIPDFEHGDELRIKIESDGEGTLYLYANDMDNPLSTIVFPEDAATEDKSNPFLTGSGVGIRAEIPSVTYKEIVITIAD
jgi:hypothetical protein